MAGISDRRRRRHLLYILRTTGAGDLPATGSLGTIAPIAQLSLHPETVVQSGAFQALTSTIALPTPAGPVTVERTNPFVAP